MAAGHFQFRNDTSVEQIVDLTEAVRLSSAQYIAAFRADVLGTAKKDKYTEYYARAQHISQQAATDHSGLINFLAVSLFSTGVDESVRLPRTLNLQRFQGILGDLLQGQAQTGGENCREAAICWSSLRLVFTPHMVGAKTSVTGVRTLDRAKSDFFAVQLHTHPNFEHRPKVDALHFSVADMFTFECGVLGAMIVVAEAGALIAIKRAGMVTSRTAGETLDLLKGMRTDVMARPGLTPGQTARLMTKLFCHALNYDLYIIADLSEMVARRLEIVKSTS